MLDNFVSQVQHEVVQVVEHVSRGFGELLVLAERIASCHNSFRDVARDVGQTEVATLETVGQPRVVDAAEVEDRGMEIVHVHLLAVFNVAIA